MQHAIDVAHGVADRGGVKEVELGVSGRNHFVTRGLREGAQRAAQHAGSPGD